jgi:hypothetical protein
MRKFMSLVMISVILASMLWLSVDNAAAEGTITFVGARFVWGKGVVFVFEATGYKNSDVKDAVLTIGSKTFKVHCTVNKKDEKIVCVAGGRLTQYAGQIGTLSVAGHAFYVTIPNKPALPWLPGGGSLSCPPGTDPGADVFFDLPGEGTWTRFIGGSTLSEVQQNAENTGIVEFGGSFDIVSPLYCAQEPS